MTFEEEISFPSPTLSADFVSLFTHRILKSYFTTEFLFCQRNLQIKIRFYFFFLPEWSSTFLCRWNTSSGKRKKNTFYKKQGFLNYTQINSFKRFQKGYLRFILACVISVRLHKMESQKLALLVPILDIIWIVFPTFFFLSIYSLFLFLQSIASHKAVRYGSNSYDSSDFQSAKKKLRIFVYPPGFPLIKKRVQVYYELQTHECIHQGQYLFILFSFMCQSWLYARSNLKSSIELRSVFFSLKKPAIKASSMPSLESFSFS